MTQLTTIIAAITLVTGVFTQGTWALSSINGKAATEGNEVTLTFEGNTYHQTFGRSRCAGISTCGSCFAASTARSRGTCCSTTCRESATPSASRAVDLSRICNFIASGQPALR